SLRDWSSDVCSSDLGCLGRSAAPGDGQDEAVDLDDRHRPVAGEAQPVAPGHRGCDQPPRRRRLVLAIATAIAAAGTEMRRSEARSEERRAGKEGRTW